MNRLQAVATLVIIIAMGAALNAQATKPSGKLECHPMTWKAKANAPAVVSKVLGLANDRRQLAILDGPRRISALEPVREKTANATIDPKLKTDGYKSEKAYKFRTQEAKAKELASIDGSIKKIKDEMTAATKPYVIPDEEIEGVKIKEWVEPIEHPAKK